MQGKNVSFLNFRVRIQDNSLYPGLEPGFFYLIPIHAILRDRVKASDLAFKKCSNPCHRSLFARFERSRGGKWLRHNSRCVRGIIFWCLIPTKSPGIGGDFFTSVRSYSDKVNADPSEIFPAHSALSRHVIDRYGKFEGVGNADRTSDF